MQNSLFLSLFLSLPLFPYYAMKAEVFQQQFLSIPKERQKEGKKEGKGKKKPHKNQS